MCMCIRVCVLVQQCSGVAGGVATGVAIGGDDDVAAVVDRFYDAYGWPRILQFKKRNQQQQKCSGNKK
ncbi:hypothetical protein F0562_005855 [Nyssa sinensis]|uniref:Uncharacterized protein n=1 Tax=Nyssa sinensis TaxID=561372 RepID=A0A5J5AQ86_9ASTE|nr:hypothetical protein F0562_005855 [Nyssa sinensis]